MQSVPDMYLVRDAIRKLNKARPKGDPLAAFFLNLIPVIFLNPRDLPSLNNLLPFTDEVLYRISGITDKYPVIPFLLLFIDLSPEFGYILYLF